MSAALAAERDAQARALALDPAHSIILEAPAGSGKTTVLTQRFLRLLCEVDEPEEIIAITFTRKAAAEMAERVFRALRGEGGSGSAQGQLICALGDAVRERSRQRGWSLDVSPQRLRIQTIDSLNRSLAAQLPLAARGAGELGVLERPLDSYRMAARRTLLDAQEHELLRPDVELLFERLENDFGRCEGLLAAMLGARAHWLPHLLPGSGADAAGTDPLQPGDPQLRARVQESLEAIVRERLQRARQIVPAALVAEGLWLGRQAAVHRRAQNAPSGPWCAFEAGTAADTAGESGDSPFDGSGVATLEQWQGLAQLALTQKESWRQKLTQREGFPATQKLLKERAQRWLQQMAGVPGACELLQELALLPPPLLPAEDAQALAALARLLRLAAQELQVVFGELGRVDYAHIAGAARWALGQEGAPSELGLRLDARIRHILVDEFQDTSIEQTGLLECLTAGWQAGDGRTLFVVGDPMQSIYQFREAEVGLFLRARAHGIGPVQLTPLSLRRNFRSSAALVAWVNGVFGRCFPGLDDPRSSAVRYIPSIPGTDAQAAATAADTGAGAAAAADTQAAAPTAAVQLHRLAAGDRAGEAAQIAALVRRLRAGEPAASIAILVAARPHAAPIVAALGALQIPVAGVDLVPLAQLPIVRDLAALTRALDHLADRTAWLAVLRAPWCGLTLRDLGTLVAADRQLTVWEAVSDDDRAGRLEAGARQRLLRVRGVLQQALALRDRLPPARWVETTWLHLGGPAACAEELDLLHARTFFEALARWSAEPDWPGPLGLDERLAGLYAQQQEGAAAAVQIMTIHRAKGLEFDTVILPGLGRRLRASPEPLLRWLDLPRDRDGSDLLMAAMPPAAAREPSALSAYIKSLQARRSAHERARLLYVAATRARTQLHLFGELPPADAACPVPAPAAGSLLATLWPGLAPAFLREALAADTQPQSRSAPPAAAPRTLVRLRPDWALPPLPAGPRLAGLAVASYEPSESEASGAQPLSPAGLVEQAVCAQLRRYARQSRLPDMQDPRTFAPALRERLQALQALQGAQLQDCTQTAAAMLAACLADARLQWMFAPAQAQRESPLALTGMFAGRLTSIVADLSFVDEKGARWLIDFVPAVADAQGRTMAGAQRAAYRPRLEKYRELARQLGERQPRAAVYLPLLRIFEETAAD